MTAARCYLCRSPPGSTYSNHVSFGPRSSHLFVLIREPFCCVNRSYHDYCFWHLSKNVVLVFRIGALGPGKGILRRRKNIGPLAERAQTRTNRRPSFFSLGYTVPWRVVPNAKLHYSILVVVRTLYLRRRQAAAAATTEEGQRLAGLEEDLIKLGVSRELLVETMGEKEEATAKRLREAKDKQVRWREKSTKRGTGKGGHFLVPLLSPAHRRRACCVRCATLFLSEGTLRGAPLPSPPKN